MLECSGQGEPEGRKEDVFFGLDRDKRIDNDALKRMGKKGDSLSDSAPIRRQKVEEAKRKKQNGDYDSQEVYRKIADRLIDLFGI